MGTSLRWPARSAVLRTQAALEIVRADPLLDQGQDVGIFDVLVGATGEATASDPSGFKQTPENAMDLVAFSR